MGMQIPSDSMSPPPAKSNRTLIIIVVVVLVLCCCCAGAGLGYWLWNNGDEIMRQINSSSQVPWGTLPLA